MKNLKGFTLIELLVSVGISAVIISAIVYFVSWGIKMNIKIRVNQEVIKNAEPAMEQIIFEIRHAQNIYTPTSNLGSHPGQLSLKSALNIPQGETYAYVDFYLEDEKLYLKREGENPQALTSEKVKVTNLVFKHLNSDISSSSIQVELGLEYKSPSLRPEWQAQISLTSSAGLRSY